MVFFSSSISGVIQWCRALKHGLGAGIPITRVFEMQATKGPRNLRSVARRGGGGSLPLRTKAAFPAAGPLIRSTPTGARPAAVAGA